MKSSLGLLAVVGLFAVLGLMYAVPAVSASGAGNIYNFWVTQGTYCSSCDGGVGAWLVPANTALTFNVCTNDASVTSVTYAGAGTPPPTSFGPAISSTPTVGTCPSTTVTGNTFSVTESGTYFSSGQTWVITVIIQTGSGTHTFTKVIEFQPLTVTPEFPAGVILAVLAPIGALIGYGKFGKSTARKPA